MPSAYLKLKGMESLQCTRCGQYAMDAVELALEEFAEEACTITDIICQGCLDREKEGKT